MAMANLSAQTTIPLSAKAVYRKITLRLLPVLFMGYILAYLDRVNVGFAKLAMKEELWFSDAVFATGSGIFFIGYFIFEVPGNLLLHRIGARLWITRIMITWGIVSALCALSSSALSFYIFRFLLGVAEAGFFPGILLYLTYWFPNLYRVRMVALFMTAVTVAGVLGSPVSGWILQTMQGAEPLKSWQWLFILEGIPSIVFGCCLPLLLTDSPQKAKWLNDEEKNLVVEALKKEEAEKTAGGGLLQSGAALRSGKVWLFSLVYFGLVIGLYGVSFWLPQIMEYRITTNKVEIGWLTAIPWACASVGMVLYGQHSDRSGERHKHIMVAALVATTGFVVSGLSDLSNFWLLLALCIATTGVMCAVTTFWSLPSTVLSGTAAAAGIALVNSVGNLAGYLSPELFAWLKGRFDLGYALWGTGLAQGLSAVVVLILWCRLKKKVV